MQKMRIKPAYDDGAETLEVDLAIDILGDDDKCLFTISMHEGGVIEISSSGTTRHDGVIFDGALMVRPRYSNVVAIERVKYKA